MKRTKNKTVVERKPARPKKSIDDIGVMMANLERFAVPADEARERQISKLKLAHPNRWIAYRELTREGRFDSVEFLGQADSFSELDGAMAVLFPKGIPDDVTAVHVHSGPIRPNLFPSVAR